MDKILPPAALPDKGTAVRDENWTTWRCDIDMVPVVHSQVDEDVMVVAHASTGAAASKWGSAANKVFGGVTSVSTGRGVIARRV